VEQGLDTSDSIMEHLAFMEKHKCCEICEKGFDKPLNFRMHEEERHTAKNTPEIIARKLKQNERRNIGRKKRYVKEPAKQLSKTSRRKKRATVERDGEGSEGAGDGDNAKKTARKTGGFQVKTKLFTQKDLDLFFKPRCAGSYNNDPKSRRFENLSI